MEKIYLERERESFSLPARGMTHLLPADRRMDGWREGGRRWTGGEGWKGKERGECDEDRGHEERKGDRRMWEEGKWKTERG